MKVNTSVTTDLKMSWKCYWNWRVFEVRFSKRTHCLDENS